MGTLEKAEIEVVPNIEFILIGIALLSLRGPKGKIVNVDKPCRVGTLKKAWSGEINNIGFSLILIVLVSRRESSRIQHRVKILQIQ